MGKRKQSRYFCYFCVSSINSGGPEMIFEPLAALSETLLELILSRFTWHSLTVDRESDPKQSINECVLPLVFCDYFQFVTGLDTVLEDPFPNSGERFDFSEKTFLKTPRSRNSILTGPWKSSYAWLCRFFWSQLWRNGGVHCPFLASY